MNQENNFTINRLAEHLRREQPHLMRYACYRLGDSDDAKDALQDAEMFLMFLLTTKTKIIYNISVSGGRRWQNGASSSAFHYF